MSGHPGDLLSAWLDGELSPEEVMLVASHVEVCPPCAAERDHAQAGRATLRALPPLETTPDVLQAFPAVHLADLLSARLDGEIDADLLPGVDAHLAACPTCTAEHDEVAWARATVRLLPPLEPPDEGLRPIWALGAPFDRWPTHQGTRPRQILVAAAAVVAMFGLVGRSAPSETSRPSAAALVSSRAPQPSSSPGSQVVTWARRGSTTEMLGGDGPAAPVLASARSLPGPERPGLLVRLRRASRHLMHHLS